MALTESEELWYQKQIAKYDPKGDIISIDNNIGVIEYSSSVNSDETKVREKNPEEYVHALLLCMLCSKKYGYKIENIYHEQHFQRGSSGAKDDEADYVIYDDEGLPFALVELKSADDYKKKKIRERAIKYQLFATASLAKNPPLLLYGTINPGGEAEFVGECIDYSRYKSYESWLEAGEPHSTIFPVDYQDIDYEPYVCGGKKDLRVDCNQADFRAVAAGFHSDFFGEHPDNSLYVNLVKCLLAKIYDERTRKTGETYFFQIEHRLGKPEKADRVYKKVNDLYKEAYIRYIDSEAHIPDEIDPKEFSKERVKEVVMAMQGMSITKGAALNGDIIGAFFEEILRVGFKQDKGMYFTHSNIAKFMVEAIDLDGLTRKIWNEANHPDNRLPYIIDPACGSGTFLLHAMPVVTKAIKEHEKEMVRDFEARQFYNARMSDDVPNYWAENFIYGFDPKFIMAITAKVNMVLHGDGSAHIFKYDAFSDFSKYRDIKLRPIAENSRSVERCKYSKDMCETFDVILSNPPFGVSLTNETSRGLNKAFLLSESTPSEALFIERCFQLLKPNGRLGIVLPESVFNAVDNMPVRIFLYRMFKIKAIVSLPRNVFIDTPTLTSLLFAQKKSADEIEIWDKIWQKYYENATKAFKDARMSVSKKNKDCYVDSEEVVKTVTNILSPFVNLEEWIVKKGKNSEIMPIRVNPKLYDVSSCMAYYTDLLKSASIEKIIIRYAFEKTSVECDQEFATFMVNEIGYKLSKRKEKSRPNQLCEFIGEKSKKKIYNLHLGEESIKVKYNINDPQTVLDFIKKEVTWE